MGLSLLEAAIQTHGAKSVFAGMTQEQRDNVKFNWKIIARPEQLAPRGDWQKWLLLAGRGFGKTRSGAEWVRDQVWTNGRRRGALVAPTAADARDVMIEGESGILNCGPKDERPIYQPSKRKLVWPNGAVASIFSSEKPDRMRGPQYDFAWGEELGSWYIPPPTSADKDPLDMLLFGLRLGNNPQAIFTTTPRPTKHIKGLIKDGGCITTRGNTYENRANLAQQFFDVIIAKYEGTRLGRQEIYAELLDDNPDAMFQSSDIAAGRVKKIPDTVRLVRIVVAVDPAAKSKETSDDTGIVVVGLGSDGHYYVLADDTCHLKPAGWAKQVVRSFNLNAADRVIGETNNGGEMVEAVLRTENKDIPYKEVHASRGKAMRAEPIASLYEQHKVHHVGVFPKLEDEMTEWSPLEDQYSPNRLDALVWGLSELSGNISEIKMVKVAGA